MVGSEVVLVTNVGLGFGRAIALSYGNDGYHVVCADKDVDLAAKTAAEIEELGGNAIPIQADMTTQMDVRKAFDKVFEIYGDLSGIVHTATRESSNSFQELSEHEFTELFTENVRSTFLTLKLAERLIEDAWIVLISPPKSANQPHMLSTRGAITRMAAAFEANNEGLRVNVVVPSRPAADPKHDAQLVETVRFLGSGVANGISGHRMHVNLPPPPKFVEFLLPEVQAALDSSIRQDDLEASLYEPMDGSFDYEPDGSVNYPADFQNAADDYGVSAYNIVDETNTDVEDGFSETQFSDNDSHEFNNDNSEENDLVSSEHYDYEEDYDDSEIDEDSYLVEQNQK